MDISLSPELEAFAAEQVKAGRYSSVAAVVDAGLRRLREDQPTHPRFVAASMTELEAKLTEGVRQLDRGEGVPGEAAFARLRERAVVRDGLHG